MSYTTITDLPERLKNDLVGSEYMLLADPDYSYKVSLNTINETLLELSAGSYQELTNKVIDDVSNYVHANAIHFYGRAVGEIAKGDPVKFSSANSEYNDITYVTKATNSTDTVIGLAEEDMPSGETGAIMTVGVLEGVNTSSFNEGDLLYAFNGNISPVQPSESKRNFVGYVLNVGYGNGKILVTTDDPQVDAKEIIFSGTGSNIVATNVEDAIVEVNNKITDLEEIVFQQATAPTVAEGASDGDIWMDTTTNTLNVYREYPLGTGVYRWEPLLYKWDDTVDGGSW